MKKKFICFILLLAMLFSIASCKDEAAQKRLNELSAKIQALETEKGVLNEKISELEKDNEALLKDLIALQWAHGIVDQTITDTPCALLSTAADKGWFTQADVMHISYFYFGSVTQTVNGEYVVNDAFQPQIDRPSASMLQENKIYAQKMFFAAYGSENNFYGKRTKISKWSDFSFVTAIISSSKSTPLIGLPLAKATKILSFTTSFSQTKRIDDFTQFPLSRF